MTASTAARIIRPLSEFEDLRPKQDEPFPAGDWRGTIERVTTRTPDFLHKLSTQDLERRGYTSPDVETFSIQFGNIRPLNSNQEDVGNRKFFSPDITLRDGIYSVEDELPRELGARRLYTSGNVVANLAQALGQIEVVEGPDGRPSGAVAEGFLAALLDGQFDGAELIFSVYHRPWVSRTDPSKSGVNVEVSSYATAA